MTGRISELEVIEERECMEKDENEEEEEEESGPSGDDVMGGSNPSGT